VNVLFIGDLGRVEGSCESHVSVGLSRIEGYFEGHAFIYVPFFESSSRVEGSRESHANARSLFCCLYQFKRPRYKKLLHLCPF
jgi:hypothetical protein